MMLDRNHFVRRATSWAVGFMLGCALPSAGADQPTAAPTDLLATYITQQFSANVTFDSSGKPTGGYTNGQLGNDWCFNVEKEVGYTWWYFDQNDGQGLMPHKVANAIRIQATYVDGDPNSNFTKYASVFLGLDVTQDTTFQEQFSATLDTLPAHVLALAETAKKAYAGKGGIKPVAPFVVGTTGPPQFSGRNGWPVLNVPGNYSSCQSLGSFLVAYALPFQIQAGALPTNPQNATFNWFADSSTFNVQTTGSNYARYWMFKGNAHAIVEIMSYSFALTSANSSHDNIRLIVGIGGGAGP
jgi:hypothetical protein